MVDANRQDITLSQVNTTQDGPATFTTHLSGNPVFPTEVFEQIIDCFRDTWIGDNRSRSALLACALTCKAWLPRCRFNLVQTVDLWEQRDIYGFLRFLRAHPFLASSVKRVRLTAQYETRKKSTQHVAVFPLMLARKLTALDHLRVSTVSFRATVVDPAFYWSLSEFPSITVLTLFDVDFSSVLQFARLISAIPSLTSLDCWGIEWSRTGLSLSSLPPQASPAPNLKILKLELSPESPSRNIAVMKDLFGFIALNGRGARLEDIQIGNHFSWSFVHVADLQASGISQLLRLSGAHLRILRPVLTAGDLPNELAKKAIEAHLNLAHNTNLELLEVCIPHMDEELQCEWLSTFLSQIESRKIKDVAILLQSFRRDMDILDKVSSLFSQALCSHIEDTFMHRKFSCLQKIIVKVEGSSKAEEGSEEASKWKTEFRSRLPKLSGREIFNVSLKLRYMEEASSHDGGDSQLDVP